MAKMFYVDLSSVSTQEERFRIMCSFDESFDISEDWGPLIDMRRPLRGFNAFWSYNSPPKFPSIPDNVKIIEK